MSRPAPGMSEGGSVVAAAIFVKKVGLGQGGNVLSTAKADVRVMFGGIALRSKRGPEPIGTIDVLSASLPLGGTLDWAAWVDSGVRRVKGFIVPVGHPFIEIPGEIMDAIGACALVAIAD